MTSDQLHHDEDLIENGTGHRKADLSESAHQKLAPGGRDS
jgi:hypothetical protein